MAFPKARKGPRRGSLGSNQCLWCATSKNGSAFGRPMGITLPPAHDGHTGIRGHCCISPARREAVWAADAAIGVATAETAAPDATSRRVNVPGLYSGSGSQLFCESAAVFAATARSRTRRGIAQRKPEALASQIAVVANLWTTGAEGLGSSQSRRITKPRKDPKQPLRGEQRANGSTVC